MRSRHRVVAVRLPFPLRSQMHLTANKPNATTPTVFRLGSGKLSGKGNGARNGLRRPTKSESNAIPPSRSEKRFRIDQAEHHPVPSRMMNLVKPKISALAEPAPPPQPDRSCEPITTQNASVSPVANDDQLNDHAGSLIEQLQKWSLKLDERESLLDLREQELNRRQRVLRQGQSIKGN